MKEHRPLAGRRILLTRAHSQAAALDGMLHERGAHTLECPTIALSPPVDWCPADRCLERLTAYDGLIFTSVNAVEFCFQRLEETGMSTGIVRHKPCFAIGPATAKALASRGIHPQTVPDRHQAEGLVAVFEKEDVKGRAFLFPRAAKARELLTRYLEGRGARVDIAVVYETRMAVENQERLRQILAVEHLDYITFTSTSTAVYFAEMAGPEESFKRAWRIIPAACIGEITTDAVRRLGFGCVLTSAEATLGGLVQVLVEHAQANEPSGSPER